MKLLDALNDFVIHKVNEYNMPIENLTLNIDYDLGVKIEQEYHAYFGSTAAAQFVDPFHSLVLNGVKFLTVQIQGTKVTLMFREPSGPSEEFMNAIFKQL